MSQANLANQHKFPSVSSIHSMVSLGYLPPGHGYIPRKQKPDKPYGPSYIAIMNRTWRGPGRKYLKYALACFCSSLFLYIAAALYFTHRNVHRVITRHSEPTAACMLILAICLTAYMFHNIHKARIESNRWRSFVRFEPDGLFHVAPTNEEYAPKDPTKLQTGTYGPRAVKEIPKPKYMKGRSRLGSQKERSKGTAMATLAEGDEASLIDTMGSMDFADLPLPPPPSNGDRNNQPQSFGIRALPDVHKPEPQRPDSRQNQPFRPQYPPQQQKPPIDYPIDRREIQQPVYGSQPPIVQSIPQRSGTPVAQGTFGQQNISQRSATPGALGTIDQPRPAPGQRSATPVALSVVEPRPAPGQRSATPGAMSAIEPRPAPGQRSATPGALSAIEPRPAPSRSIRPSPSPLPPPMARAPAGAKRTPDPHTLRKVSSSEC